MNGGASRPGGVLVVVVLAILALGLVATGLLYLSGQEVLIAGGEERALRERLAAESALRSALAAWRTSDHRDLSLGERRALSSVTSESGARVTAERLAGPLFLLRGEAAGADGVGGTAALLLRALELDELWAAFPAALNAPAVELGNAEGLVGFDPDAEPASAGHSCQEPVAPVLARLFGDPTRPPHLPIPEGATLRLGPLAIGELRALADHIAPPTLSPAPVEGAAGCEPGAVGNWGDPRHPPGPCAGYFPLIFAPGDLHLAGGVGQGILVVQGDLTISAGGTFAGAALVTGALHVTGASRISGAVLALDPARTSTIEDGSRLAYDPCALLDAFTNAPELNRPFHPPGRGWLPWF